MRMSFRQRGNDLSRDRLRLDAAWVVGIVGRPDALLEAVDRELTLIEDAVAHGKARAAPFLDRALDDDLLIEAARFQEPRALLHQRHAEDRIFLAHLGWRQAGAGEEI